MTVKTISPQVLGSNIESIIREREKLAQVKGEKFSGVSETEVVSELRKRLGEDWILKKESPVKFTRQDLNAVANSRFMRKSGTKVLMILAIVILALANLAQFRVLPVLIYYGLLGLAAFAFLYYFARKQVQARREFWKGIDGDGVEKE